jgi:high-affinity Fe2+/Pb2+ permease
MTWGPGVPGPFLVVMGIFLLLSSVGLFLMLRWMLARFEALLQNDVTRSGRSRRIGFQYKHVVASSVLIGLLGVACLIFGILNL